MKEIINVLTITMLPFLFWGAFPFSQLDRKVSQTANGKQQFELLFTYPAYNIEGKITEC